MLETNKKEGSSASLSWRDGPVGRKRRCTDVIFLVRNTFHNLKFIFTRNYFTQQEILTFLLHPLLNSYVVVQLLLVCSWIVMVFIGLSVTGVISSPHLKKGDLSKLTNGLDYKGKLSVCLVAIFSRTMPVNDNTLHGFLDFTVRVPKGNMCGKTNVTTAAGKSILDLPMSYVITPGVSVCVEACPTERNFVKFHCKYEIEFLIEEQLKTLQSNVTRNSLYLFHSTRKDCFPFVKSGSYLGYCTPMVMGDIISDELKIDYDSNITSTSSFNASFLSFDDAMTDLYMTKFIILAFGVGCSVLLGFLFLMLMRLHAILPIMIWTLILGISGALCFGGYLLQETSLRWEKEGAREPREISALLWLSIVSYSSAGIWFITVCAIRKRIMLATACVREASTAISTIPLIVLYPLLQVFGFVAYFVAWSFFMVYLASSGNIETKCWCPNIQTEGAIENNDSDSIMYCSDGCYPYKAFEYTNQTKYAGFFMLFSFFWTSQFIVAVGEVTVALTISMWYFSRNKNTISNTTLFGAIGLSFYHLGSIAFGSLIIAVVKTAKAILMYIQKKTSKVQNRTAKMILMSIQCCLCCVDKCIKFVSKNAYIQIAMHGDPFCVAAKNAFTLIVENVVRISAVSVVSSLVLFILKAFIVTASTLLGYIYLEYYYDEDLKGLYFITILMFATSLATAEMFNQVFAMTIATILHCFVSDERMYEVRVRQRHFIKITWKDILTRTGVLAIVILSQPDQRFASGSLVNTIDTTQKGLIKAKSVHPDTVSKS